MKFEITYLRRVVEVLEFDSIKDAAHCARKAADHSGGLLKVHSIEQIPLPGKANPSLTYVVATE
jgi:hypothetical protein